MTRPRAVTAPAASDRGTADVLGLVMLAPAVLAVALLVMFLGRQVDSHAQVRSAATSAAQAAALERSPAAAVDAARRAAAAMLVDRDTCTSPEVAVDVAEFVPGGVVHVTVTCETSNRGLEVVAAGGRRFSATASATLDQFRAVAP